MHIIVGLAALVGVFFTASLYLEAGFHGYFDAAAAIMLVGGPPAILVVSYDPTTLAEAFRILATALGYRGDPEQEQLVADLLKFGRAVREGRAAEAGRLIESADTHPYLREAGGLVLQRADAETLSETLATLAFARMQRIKRGEDVMHALAAMTPAVGMTGTIVGLIQLLANLQDYTRVGAGMAVALLTTLYGLILAHGLYMPLARHVERYGKRVSVHMKLLERGMLAIAAGRPLHDLRLLSGDGEAEPAPAAASEAA